MIVSRCSVKVVFGVMHLVFDDVSQGSDLRLKIMDYQVYLNRSLIEEGFRTIVKQEGKEG